MREKGFAPVIVILGVLLIAVEAVVTYYLIKPKPLPKKPIVSQITKQITQTNEDSKSNPEKFAYIKFTDMTNGQGDLWTIKTNTDDRKLLAKNLKLTSIKGWSKDNSLIYAHAKQMLDDSLFAINANDGSYKKIQQSEIPEQVVIDDNKLLIDGKKIEFPLDVKSAYIKRVLLSPNKTKISFLKTAPVVADLYVFYLNSKKLVQITNGDSVDAVRWLDDDQLIYANGNLFTVKSDNSGKQKLASGVRFFDLSKSTKKLIYYKDKFVGNTITAEEFYLFDFQSRNSSLIKTVQGATAGFPTISPRADFGTYSYSEYIGPTETKSQTFLLNLKNSEEVKLCEQNESCGEVLWANLE